MRVLKPIKETTEDWEALEKKILELFKKEFYFPLLAKINEPKKVLMNAKLDLLEAIRSGHIEFSKGKFTGKFNSVISKELRDLGAKWDRRTGSYKINLRELPMEFRNAVSASESNFLAKIAGVDKVLAQILPEAVAQKLSVEKLFDTTLWKTNKSLKETLKGITIAPDLKPEQRKKIADEWQNNLKIYIKDFTEKETSKLRKDIQKTILAGNRQESLVKTIQKSYNVSQNKAKFLARQETSLLMSKFKETRYMDAGVNEYIWTCVNMPKDTNPNQHTPGNVRYDHAILNGKIFRWDSPPVVNEKGERKNPGQDYNCRCTARPVVRGLK